MTYWGAEAPAVEGVTGFFWNGRVRTHSKGTRVRESIPFNVGMQMKVEEWVLSPNPDLEWISIKLPESTRLDELVIDTVSMVPESGTHAMILAGLGLVGFLTRSRGAGVGSSASADLA